ncbi:MAG: hypothetical protein WCY59_03700 [Anaerovoracaceae bacterium]
MGNRWLQPLPRQESVASYLRICYTDGMIYTVPRYIFMILLCLPILGLGVYLFDKLLVEVLDIQREKRAKHEKRLAERRRKEQFEIDYQRRRGGGSFH